MEFYPSGTAIPRCAAAPVLRVLLAFFALWAAAGARAQEARCPQPQAIEAGNRAAEALFRRHAVNPAATGSAPAARPAGFVDAADFGARGDGRADDSAALQRALSEGGKVWLAPRGVYRLTRRLSLAGNAALASDGSATLLLAAGPGALDNALGERSEGALYGERGVALRIEGSDIAVRDLHLVREFAEDRYVIGIDVRASRRVTLERLRLRGFSLAPGIVTIRSSEEVRVASLLIHDSCTASTQLPVDVPAFQITGISIDDVRVERRGSARLIIENNVIAGLRMIPLTSRRVQTDGIHFAQIGTGHGSVVRDNYVADVDEALDIFGSGIEATGNRLHATGTVVKLIHGARSVTLRGNQISAAGEALAIGLYRGAEEERHVRDVVIEGNHLRVPGLRRPAISVDSEGPFAPSGITVQDNRFEVSACNQSVLHCSAQQCATRSNQRRVAGAPTDCGN